jgi:hypothetical protein
MKRKRRGLGAIEETLQNFPSCMEFMADFLSIVGFVAAMLLMLGLVKVLDKV